MKEASTGRVEAENGFVSASGMVEGLRELGVGSVVVAGEDGELISCKMAKGSCGAVDTIAARSFKDNTETMEHVLVQPLLAMMISLAHLALPARNDIEILYKKHSNNTSPVRCEAI